MDIFPDKNPKTGFIADMQKALLDAQDSGQVKDKDAAKRLLQSVFSSANLDLFGLQLY
jgi:hypothetical protein